MVFDIKNEFKEKTKSFVDNSDEILKKCNTQSEVISKFSFLTELQSNSKKKLF